MGPHPIGPRSDVPGASHWRTPRRLALGPAIASGLSALARLLSGWAEAVPRGVRGPHARPPAPAERITRLMREGLFEPAEQEMVRGVFRLGDRRAGSLMTPLRRVVWLDVADSPGEMQRKIAGSPHSRFPVCDGGIDAILGVVQAKDLLIQTLRGQPFGIKGLLRLPLFVYEGTSGRQVLAMFKESGMHFAVVLDEFGSVKGVLTLNDILEAIVGDLSADPDRVGSKAVRRRDGSWLLDGSLSLHEFGDLIETADLPRGDYRTLGGFVTSRMGHIPRVAEWVEWAGFRFEVVEMDGYRVAKVLTVPPAMP